MLTKNSMPPQHAARDRLRDRTVAWLPAVLLLIAYPLALAVPAGAGISLRFHIELPVFFGLALFTLWNLLCRQWGGVKQRFDLHEHAARRHTPVTVARVLQVGVVAVVVACFASAFASERMDAFAAVRSIGFFAIPIYFATCPRKWLWRPLPLCLAVVWVLNAAHGIAGLYLNSRMVALAGNRNWAAALIAALVPWVWLAIGWDGNRARRNAAVRSRCLRVCLIVGSGALAAILCWHAASRGVWIVLAAYLLIFQVAARFTGATRWAAVSLLVVAVSLGGWVARDRLVSAAAQDIRLPLWRATLSMIADHPVAGVGPGNFRRAYPGYRLQAHRDRAVAAPVTEHPHNQLLDVAATLGIPLALAWAVLLLLPLARRRKLSAHWQAIHFSACLLVGHAMLDKTLVQAPTDMLALMFLGLLWRPWLACRLRPGLGRPELRRVFYGFAIVLGLAAAFAGGQMLIAGWQHRRGILLQSDGKPHDAYRAFARAATIMPRQLEADVFAGAIASRILRDPERAMQHFANVRRQEPDFGRVNGEIGLAMGRAGDHAGAYPFFKRDAALFPLDLDAQSRRLQNALILQRYDELDDLRKQVAAARVRTARRRLGETQFETLVHAWLEAVLDHDSQSATATARSLVNALGQQDSAEPILRPFLESIGHRQHVCDGMFDARHAEYWSALAQWSAHRHAAEDRTVPQLAGEFQSTLPPILETAARGSPFQARLAELWRHTPEYGFALHVQQADPAHHAALVSGSDAVDSAGVLVTTAKGTLWLVLPAQGRALPLPGDAAHTLSALRQALAVPAAEPLEIRVPVFPPEFCSWTQALADLVRSVLPDASGVPVFGRSPTDRLYHWRMQTALFPRSAARDAEKAHAEQSALAPARSVRLTFDPVYAELFRGLSVDR